jgi:exodeoxyribonuclease VII large subunit
MEARLHRAADQAEHLRRQVVALSPQSTLERGYAVVQHRDGRIVMDQDDVGVGELLRVRVARGDFGVRPVTAGAEDAPPKTARTARTPKKAGSTPRQPAGRTTNGTATKAASPRAPRAGTQTTAPPTPAAGDDGATS